MIAHNSMSKDEGGEVETSDTRVHGSLARSPTQNPATNFTK